MRLYEMQGLEPCVGLVLGVVSAVFYVIILSDSSWPSLMISSSSPFPDFRCLTGVFIIAYKSPDGVRDCDPLTSCRMKAVYYIMNIV